MKDHAEEVERYKQSQVYLEITTYVDPIWAAAIPFAHVSLGMKASLPVQRPSSPHRESSLDHTSKT